MKSVPENSMVQGAYTVIIQTASDEWQNLCTRYLPVIPEDSTWRFSRTVTADDPEQGWKIHVSATILSANKIFKKVAPFLHNLGILFKAPNSLRTQLDFSGAPW